MSELRDQTLIEMNEHGKDFGDFYPTHHLLIAFANEKDTKDMEAQLLAEGKKVEDCRYFSARQVAEASQHGMDTAGVFSAMGASIRMVALHNELARKGAHFLLIRPEDDAEVERIMQRARGKSLQLAQRYHRLAIETLYSPPNH
jgi:hypothetical protein